MANEYDLTKNDDDGSWTGKQDFGQGLVVIRFKPLPDDLRIWDRPRVQKELGRITPQVKDLLDAKAKVLELEPKAFEQEKLDELEGLEATVFELEEELKRQGITLIDWPKGKK